MLDEIASRFKEWLEAFPYLSIESMQSMVYVSLLVINASVYE